MHVNWIPWTKFVLSGHTYFTCMAAQHNFGIESVPDRFQAWTLILKAITPAPEIIIIIVSIVETSKKEYNT